MKVLAKSPFKETLNQASKIKDPVINFLAEKHVNNVKIGSPEYKNKVKEMIENALLSKKSFGIIPNSYKTLGNSLKIIPSLYETTVQQQRMLRKLY